MEKQHGNFMPPFSIGLLTPASPIGLSQSTCNDPDRAATLCRLTANLTLLTFRKQTVTACVMFKYRNWS